MRTSLLTFAALALMGLALVGCSAPAEERAEKKESTQAAPATRVAAEEPATTEGMTPAAAPAGAANLSTAEIKVKGMSCTSCAGEVKSVLQALDGVKDCKVDGETGVVTVEFEEGKASPEMLAQVINDKTPYDAQPNS